MKEEKICHLISVSKDAKIFLDEFAKTIQASPFHAMDMLCFLFAHIYGMLQDSHIESHGVDDENKLDHSILDHILSGDLFAMSPALYPEMESSPKPLH